MCHLNILVKRDGVRMEQDPVGLLQATTGYSYIMNDHGEGAYFTSKQLLVKGDEKLNFVNYANEVRKSRMILTHQRIATSGMSAKNHQPFRDNGLVFMHNGIISSYAGKKHSDTFNMFKHMKKLFNRFIEQGVARQDAIVNMIKCVFDGLQGMYSCALYDEVLDVLYYWKESTTTINFWKAGTFLYISTGDVNSIFNYEATELKIEDYVIYQVTNEAEVYELSTIERPKYTNTQLAVLHSYGAYSWDDDDSRQFRKVRDTNGVWIDGRKVTNLDQHGDVSCDTGDYTICGRCQSPCMQTTYNEHLDDFLCAGCNLELEKLMALRKNGGDFDGL